MKKVLYLIPLFLLPACSVKEEESLSVSNSDTVQAVLETKASNSSASSDDHTLLLFLEEGVSLTQEMEKAGVSSLEPLFPTTPGKEKVMSRHHLDKWYLAKLSHGVSPENAARLLAPLTDVKHIEYNTILQKESDCVVMPYEGPLPVTKATDALFNDPMLADQWAYINIGDQSISSKAKAGGDINVKDVWASLTTGDPDIVVAVIDEGVKYTHPDLAANMWTDKNGKHGYNFVHNNDIITWDNADDSGHGTHCAGTIAAVNNNGIGVSGIAGGSGNNDGVKIMTLQVFDGKTGGTVAISARAFQYAADHGASVISCSFGYQQDVFRSDKQYYQYAAAEVDALRYYMDPENCNNTVLDGNIAIFAAGNESQSHSHYPGALSFIISVSALGPDMLPAYYTNYGPGCNIAAPGGEWNHKLSKGSYTSRSAILSTLAKESSGLDYGYMQGSSMACPHVSGIAALALSYAKKLGKTFTQQEFKNMIMTAANDIDKEILNVKNKSSYVYGGGDLNKYYHQMGTGSIDTWELMMKIEGIPSVQVPTGSEDWVDLSKYFGTAYSQLTYLGVEVMGNGKEAIGLQKDPEIKYNRLFLHPTKAGSCKIKVSAIGGGNVLGGDDSIGGMEVSQVISVIARPATASNGGWL